MSPSQTDRIAKRIELKAPVARVWRALTDHQEFGTWFKVVLEGPFVPGRTTRGRITHRGYEHIAMEVRIERMEPERSFAFRWHPYAVDPSVDYSQEPTTLVEFTLTPTPTGTLLELVESGFDAIPSARRAEAFRMNDGGWEQQMKNIASHVVAPA